MNILIGKCGVTLKFGCNDISLGDALYMNLFKAYPQHQFYLVTPNNLHKLPQDELPKNLHYVPSSVLPKKADEQYKCKTNVMEYLQSLNVKFDFGIIVHSRESDLCSKFNNFVQRVKYADIGWYCIQQLEIPYIVYNDDANALGCGLPYDVHAPKVMISQFYGKIMKQMVVDKFELARRHKLKECWRDIKGDFETFMEEVKCDYGDCEKVPLIEKGHKVDFRNLPKTGNWLLGARLTPVRVKMYNEWFGVDSPFKGEIPLYINGEVITEAKNLTMPIVKKSFAEMQDEMWNARYAFVCQNSNIRRFVTGKFWDMIYYGIIPFYDKNTYDLKNLLNAPEICRVSNPQELYERVQMLDNDEELYRKTLNELYDLLKDEYFDPDYLIHKIFDRFLNVEKYEDIKFD